MSSEMTFASYLSLCLKENDISMKELTAELNKTERVTSYNTIYSYKTGSAVPTLDMAKKILTVFGSPLNETELKTMIQLSKDTRTGEDDEQGVLQRGIRLRMSDFNDMTVSSFVRDINLRITDLKNLQINNINQYITYLIKEDMSKTIWAGKEEK